MISVNLRKLAQNDQAGISRYMHEIISRRPEIIEIDGLKPGNSAFLEGILGLFWDQIAVPLRSFKKFLWSPNNFASIFKSNQIVTIHDVAPIENPLWYDKRFALLFATLVPISAKRCKHIITVSNDAKQKIVRYAGINPDKITVIPLGVDHNKFFPASENDVKTTLKKHGLKSKSYILLIGPLDERKNLEFAVIVLSKLLESFQSAVSIVITGKKRNRTTIYEGINNKSVKFTGFVSDEDLRCLYSGALFLVFPSLYEGFGLPVLEAMTCGCPVVASRSTSIPEVLGECGSYFTPNSEEELKVACQEMLLSQELRDNYSKLGRERSLGFNWDLTAKKTWETIDKWSKS